MTTQASSIIISTASKGLIVLDSILDLVPLGSTASNLVDLSLKHLVIKDMDASSSAFKDYIEHIQDKKTGTCLAYSVPVVGNVIKLGSLFYRIIKPEEKTPPAPVIKTPLPAHLENMCDSSTIGRRLDGHDDVYNELPDADKIQKCLLKMEPYKDFTRAST